MLTAKVCVRYEDDWTAQLQRYDVFAEFLASTFRNRRYIGLVALEADDLDAALEVIEGHDDVSEVQVIERFDADSAGRTASTIFVRGQLSQFTPLQTLMYEGFLPLGSTKLENGRECFDLLLEGREELADATDLLRDFGAVSVKRVTREFRREVTPSAAEWQEVLGTIPERRREILRLAVKRGYFKVPREITLAELAEEMGITKTTASNHLRKVQQSIIEFLAPYVALAAEGDSDL
ncbi:helix-turn-helix domain-containing protein [Halosolutus halophilus]|uniref:helix-turn-helix domain-containing protein n=1 Tax=Halosolutus halophilus TaxID=1552990 RepID=UPI002235197D|nr:helix-turn-helix domain-containing protein [Halosolutus halophilus]